MSLLLLLACAEPSPDPVDSAPPVDRGLVQLDDALLLRRLSLDLRGRLPGLEELDRLEAEPSQLEAMRDEMLEDPAFGERFQHLLAEQWLTRVDLFNITVTDLGLPEDRRHDLAWSVGSEPLALMASVAAEDRPWTETVTADYTMADALLFELYPLEPLDQLPSMEEPWVKARYTDGRPEAGVAATNGLWWRYFSAPNNYNRSRAAALSRLLLCEDYLTRPVQFSAEGLADLDPDVEAVKIVPSCSACHSTLDPLAAGFFGYWIFDLYDPIESVAYHPERELMGRSLLEVDMAWFGTPVSSPAELLGQIAYDPRFLSCAVERTARAYWRRDPELADFEVMAELQEEFAAEGLRMKALIRAVTDTPDYRVGALSELAAPEESRQATRRVLSPELLAESVEQVTGLRWSLDGLDVFRDDIDGYRVLGGGIDSKEVARPLQVPGLSQAVVLKRLGQSAGQHMVDQGLLDTGLRPEDPGFDEQVQELCRKLHAVRATEPELEAYAELWAGIEQASDADQAWASLVSVLVRDQRFWSY